MGHRQEEWIHRRRFRMQYEVLVQRRRWTILVPTAIKQPLLKHEKVNSEISNLRKKVDCQMFALVTEESFHHYN